jgi:hypothetical protein
LLRQQQRQDTAYDAAATNTDIKLLGHIGIVLRIALSETIAKKVSCLRNKIKTSGIYFSKKKPKISNNHLKKPVFRSERRVFADFIAIFSMKSKEFNH